MKLEWHNELPQAARHGRRKDPRRTAFIDELKKHPNKWAVYPDGAPNSVPYYRTQNPEVDWAIRTVDGKRLVFAQWIGDLK